MLKFILAIATGLFGIDGRACRSHVPQPQPDWPDWKRQSRYHSDTVAAARRTLDGVDHPLIL